MSSSHEFKFWILFFREHFHVNFVFLSWKCVLAAKRTNCMQGWVDTCAAADPVAWSFPYIWGFFVLLHLECCVQFWSPQYKRTQTDWRKLTGGHQDDQESKHIMCEERLWKQEQFILGKGKGHLFVHYNHLIRGYRDDQARPFRCRQQQDKKQWTHVRTWEILIR